jgi:hypothetical protein
MGKMSDEWYREQAEKLYVKPRTVLNETAIEVVQHVSPLTSTGATTPHLDKDNEPMVSRGTNPGAWVMLWAWIPDPPEVNSGKEEAPANAGGTAS